MQDSESDPERALLLGAAQLAAEGDFTGATSLLDAMTSAPTGAAVLRAKIFAQCGKRAQALASLERAAELSPEDASVQSALRSLRGMSERELLARGHVGVLSALALAALVALALGLGAERIHQPVAAAHPLPPRAPISATLEAVASARPEVARAAVAPTPAPPTNGPPSFALDELRGIALESTEDAVVIRFPGGLFEPGATQIRGPALETLRALGRALSQHGKGLLITVEGQTDDIPVKTSRYSDNVALSGQRALSVADELRRASGLGPTSFQIRSSETPEKQLQGDAARAAARSAVVRLQQTWP